MPEQKSPCDMRGGEVYDFAWCDTHDETFPLGGCCPEHRAWLQRQATEADARGDWQAERNALDMIRSDDLARSRS